MEVFIMMMVIFMMMTIKTITMMMKGTGTFFSSRELMALVRVSVEVASPVTRITVVTWGIMMKRMGMLGMKRMMAMMMKQVVTVVREEERREAAEARPQAGQDAVAVPE